MPGISSGSSNVQERPRIDPLLKPLPSWLPCDHCLWLFFLLHGVLFVGPFCWPCLLCLPSMGSSQLRPGSSPPPGTSHPSIQVPYHSFVRFSDTNLWPLLFSKTSLLSFYWSFPLRYFIAPNPGVSLSPPFPQHMHPIHLQNPAKSVSK